jgi:plasmid stabilization system protein ParE
MRRIVWSDEARENLQAIQSYVAEFNLSASRRLALRLVDLTESLGVLTDRGRLVRPNVRELTNVSPYIVRYVVLPDEVRIMWIRHSARRPER